IDTLVEAEFLDSEGRRLRVTHPLLASVVVESTPPARRCELHARLAASAEDDEERARHLALAAVGPSAETAEALGTACAAAAELNLLAASLTPEAQSERRLARELAAASYLNIAGETVQANRVLERLVQRLPPGAQRGEVLLRLSQVREDDFEESGRLLDEA